MHHRFVVAYWSAFLIPLTAGAATAQKQTALRGPRLVEVTRAGPNETIGVPSSTMSAVAALRDGTLFVAVARGLAPVAGEPAEGDFELWRSDDGGVTWRKAGNAPTRRDSVGAIAAVGDRLECLWTSHDGGVYANAMHQAFDTRRDAWVGEPQTLAKGVDDEDQYYAADLVRTDDGSLVALIGSHRSPPAPVWNCGWSTGLRCLRPGKSEWTPLVQVNVASYGCLANAIVRGNVVDVTYRSCPSEAEHGLRSYDVTTGAFGQLAHENCGPTPAPNGYAANVGVLCVDGVGGRSLLHLLGDHEPGHGRICVSYARPGEAIVTTVVADDPPLIAGNETAQHFVLARGPGLQVFAYFGKRSEQCADLWQCVLENGQVAVPARVVAHGDPGAFANLVGLRDSAVFSGLHGAVSARGEACPGGMVSVFGTFPARTVWREQTSG